MNSPAIRDAISRTLTPEEVREALEELAYIRQAYARWRGDVDRAGPR